MPRLAWAGLPSCWATRAMKSSTGIHIRTKRNRRGGPSGGLGRNVGEARPMISEGGLACWTRETDTVGRPEMLPGAVPGVEHYKHIASSQGGFSDKQTRWGGRRC
jgi:hypothetical protein